MLRSLSLILVAAASTSLAACVVTTTNDDLTGGTGGQGASGGESTTGGQNTGATGGTGGSATGGAGGAGGSGGGACVDHTGNGTAVTACDSVVGGIADCGGDLGPPVAELICERGNEIYTGGAWENLLACLDAIPDDQQSACGPNAEATVQACVTKMYDEACPNPDALALCNGAKAACDANNDATFNLAGCVDELNPFGQGGRDEWQTCFDALPDATCADAQTQCNNQVSSF
jgi:hypothetical protein